MVGFKQLIHTKHCKGFVQRGLGYKEGQGLAWAIQWNEKEISMRAGES